MDGRFVLTPAIEDKSALPVASQYVSAAGTPANGHDADGAAADGDHTQSTAAKGHQTDGPTTANWLRPAPKNSLGW